MEIFQKNKKIFSFVGIFAVAIIAYELFFTGGSSSPKNSPTDPTARGLVSELSASPADAIIGRDLLTMLQQLKSITLDTTFFDDPGFDSLADVSQPIAPQPLGKSLGRTNPFGDFGKISTASSTVTNARTLPANAFGTP